MNKPMTNNEMKDWEAKTWDRCQKQAWSEAMNREEIIRMAREAGCLDESHYGSLWADKLIAFANLVAAALPQSEPTQTTHSADCYKWHHKCAIARIEETEELREALKTALAESEKLSEPVAWMHTNGVGHVYFRKKPQDKVFNPRPVYLKDE